MLYPLHVIPSHKLGFTLLKSACIAALLKSKPRKYASARAIFKAAFIARSLLMLPVGYRTLMLFLQRRWLTLPSLGIPIVKFSATSSQVQPKGEPNELWQLYRAPCSRLSRN